MNYNSYRRKTNTVAVGKISIGGTNPIAIQSMLNTDSHDAAACLKQALELQKVGCDIIRLAIPDLSCAKTIAVLKDGGVTVPLVADIHFDYRIPATLEQRIVCVRWYVHVAKNMFRFESV